MTSQLTVVDLIKETFVTVMETFVTVMETPLQVEFIAAVLFTMKTRSHYFIQY
jgi:hypothetical protein